MTKMMSLLQVFSFDTAFDVSSNIIRPVMGINYFKSSLTTTIFSTTL